MPDQYAKNRSLLSHCRILRYVIVMIAFLLILIQHGVSQSRLADVDLHRVPQKKVRRFIHKQIVNKVNDFADIHPTLIREEEKSKFKVNDQEFTIRENINRVWHAYCSASPEIAWNGRMVTFGLLLSKRRHTVAYPHGICPTLDTGQVVYLNLKLLKGIYNLAVAFEITAIDSLHKMIEFRYVTGDKSQGIQQIRFIKTDDGYTRIVHHTLFRSKSSLRDKLLYPLFHRKTVSEYHRNILHYLHPAA